MKYIHIYITNPNAESRTELSIESLQGVKRLHLMFLTQAPAAEGPHKMKVADSSSDTSAPDVSHMAATEQLTVISNFTSLVLTSMTKYSDENSSGFDVSINFDVS